jgi:hypothetical protein
MLNTGRLAMPAGADPGVWILSGGKLSEKPKNDGRFWFWFSMMLGRCCVKTVA